MQWKIKRRGLMVGLAVSLAVSAIGISSSIAQAAIDNAALPRMSTPIMNLSLVMFDTETTGFSPSKDRLVELGAVKIENGQIVARTNWLINPGRKIPDRVINVHGISNEMVKDKPSFAEIYPEFLAFIGDSILMAHNARFDVDFVRAEILRASQPLPSNTTVDTLKLFRKWYPDAPSHKVGALIDFIGIQKDEDLHRGDVDAEMQSMIFLDGLNRHPNVKTLRQFLADAGGLLVF